jgi:phage terminase large subunit-like protein
VSRSREAIYKFEPYTNRSDGQPSWQWNFLKAAANYKGRLALGSNRIGKSDMGAFEVALAVTGLHPYREFPANGYAWVIGLDNKMIDTADRPKFERFLPSRFKTKFYTQDNKWECKSDGREWVVEFKSTEMGRDKFQAVAVDLIWFDEEPKKTEIFSECMTRCIDRGAPWWMTATPVRGTAWLKALSEREDVYVSSGAKMIDNPYLPASEIELVKRDYTEDEIMVRMLGQYICFGGKPVFRDAIADLQKLLEKVNKERPSVGIIEQVAA